MNNYLRVIILLLLLLLLQQELRYNPSTFSNVTASSSLADHHDELIQQRQEQREKERIQEMEDRARLRAGADNFVPFGREHDERFAEAAVNDTNTTESTWQEPPYFDFRQSRRKTKDTLPLPKASNVSMVVLVLSHRWNFEHRRMIRRTWGQNHSLVFCVGGSDDELYGRVPNATRQAQLLEEARLHGDLLDAVHPDTYRSLPYKLRFGYQWILKSNLHAQWILKTDDDFFCRLATLQQLALRPLNSREPIVVGKIMQDTPIHRVGKWAEHLYRPKDRDTYPYWPQGSQGHAVTRRVAQFVADLTNITYYQGEDTSLGIWLEDWKDVIFVNSPYFTNHGNCNDTKALVIGHDIHYSLLQDCSGDWKDEDMGHKHVQYVYMETHKQRYAGWDSDGND